MNGLLRDIAGGVIKGAGDAIVADAQAQKEKTLQRLRNQNNLRQIEAQNQGALQRLRVSGRQDRQTLGVRQQFQGQQNAAERASQRGLLQTRQEFEAQQAAASREAESGRVSDTFRNADGEVVGVTASGETQVLGQGQRPTTEVQRVVSGDDPIGQRAGLKPGERARVTLAGGRVTSVERDDLARRNGESEFDRRVAFLRRSGFSDQEIANIESGRDLPDVAEIQLRVRDQVLKEAESGFLPLDADIDRIVRERSARVLESAQGSFGGAPAGRSATRPATQETAQESGQAEGQAAAAAPTRAADPAQGQGRGSTLLTPRSERPEAQRPNGQNASGGGAPSRPAPSLDLFPGNRSAEALGLPPGSRPIGRTANGDVVYETPNGERFVLEADAQR